MTVNLYTQAAEAQTTYVIPGPPLYGSGTGSPAPAPVSHSASLQASYNATDTSVQTTAPSAPKTTAAPAPVSSSAPSQAGTVAQFGQCGGIGFTGPTACKAPFTCTAQNGASILSCAPRLPTDD